MNIDYVGRNYHLDDRVREFTEDKLHKMLKFVEEPIEVRVTLEVEKHRHRAEFHVVHRFGVLQADQEMDSMHDAINLAVDKLEKQARRGRKKFMDSRRRAQRTNNGHHWPLEIVEGASLLAGAGGPRVIATSLLEIKPMSIEEAALQLQDSKHEFVVFRDSANDRVSVLYKRRDANYGLIAPEF
jgi:putative sigma-54 modulation protein